MGNCFQKIRQGLSQISKKKSSEQKNNTEETKKEYKYSQKSLKLLDQCHTDLKYLFLEVIKEIDCKIIEGHRNKSKQDMFFDRGASKLKWPNSYHNEFPSLAVDAVPYPLDWKDIKSFKKLMKVVKKCAKRLKIKIKCGGDWIRFRDYPHYQLKIKRKK